MRSLPRPVTIAAALLALAPLVLLGLDALGGRLGPDPAGALERGTGYWALAWLVGGLAMSPLQRASAWTWPRSLRRVLGFMTFLYASLHVLAFAWADRGWDLLAM